MTKFVSSILIESLSKYRLLKQIGSGGMGEVFLAEDLELGRKVALKILKPELAADRKRLNRFLQEARLAANLNHPHICTIFEIDAVSDPPFIAMELVEGGTLAERIAERSLTTDDIINVSLQIADALDEAHRAGIIHRDIKASNIIVNRRGQVKILDFGLAKSLDDEVSDEDVTRAKTEDGMLVGTVQYMSPEQALGRNLDGRTDLWSLGVLIYEMVTGDLPFLAATQAGTFDMILNREPAAIGSEVPAPLVSIIEKLLEKDRDLRYQTASDLVADLRRLRRSRGDESASVDAFRISTTEVQKSTGFLPRPTREATAISRRSSRFLWPSLAVLLIGASLFFAWRYFGASESAPINLRESSRQTNLGKVVDAVISPRGDHVAYVTDDGATQSLWIKQTSGGSAIQIVGPSQNVYQGLAISPDNKWVYYDVWDRVSVGEIFRIPTLGGTPQKIVHDCMPGVSVSPDGESITYVRSDDRGNRFVLLKMPSGGGDERELLSSPAGFLYRPAWSPDGRSIAVGMFGGGTDSRYPVLAEVAAEGGEPKTIWSDTENRFQPGRFVWLPEKKGLLLTLANSREFRTQIWFADYKTGRMQQVTKDINSYGSISISADGKSLLAVQDDFLLSVWNVPTDKPNDARRITDGKTEGIGLDWTPDDRIVYSSNISGNAEIWSMNSDGSDKRQLTSDATPKLSPCVPGDGKYIFYSVVGYERGSLARSDIDGRNTIKLDGRWGASCSAKSNRILYFSNLDGTETGLSRDSSAVDSRVAVKTKMIVNLAYSPDGDRIAYVYWDDASRRHGFEVLNLKDGSTRSYELPSTAVQKNSETQFVLRWTPDGKNISFVNDENGFANIWLLPLNGEKPRRVTSFNDNLIFSFAWSRDGKQLAVTRGTLTSDAILFRF